MTNGKSLLPKKRNLSTSCPCWLLQLLLKPLLNELFSRHHSYPAAGVKLLKRSQQNSHFCLEVSLYYFLGVGEDLSSSFSTKGRLFSQVVNQQHYVVACEFVCVCEFRFTSECTLKFHLLNSLIGVWMCVCLLFFLLVCVIVPSYFRLDSRNLYEENERKMKACSFFYWLLQGNVQWLTIVNAI